MDFFRKKDKVDDINRALAKALRRISPDSAEMLEDKMTKVREYPASFLHRYKIYRVEHMGENKPTLFYVGYAKGEQPYMLTGSLENYVAMSKADPVSIGTADEAAQYIETSVETTRSMSYLIYLIKSVEEIDWRVGMDEEELAEKARLVEKYGKVIGPPAAEADGQRWLATLYVMLNQTLQRYDFKVGRDGSLERKVTTLETAVPAVYGL